MLHCKNLKKSSLEYQTKISEKRLFLESLIFITTVESGFVVPENSILSDLSNSFSISDTVKSKLRKNSGSISVT